MTREEAIAIMAAVIYAQNPHPDVDYAVDRAEAIYNAAQQKAAYARASGGA